MIRKLTENLCVLFADDLHDAAQFLKDTPAKWRDRQSVTGSVSQSWDMATGWDRALKMAETGWSEGAQDLSNKLAILAPNEAEPEYSYDVAGYLPDVGLYCAGDPLHMRNDGHPEGRKPIVHLVVNVVCSGGIGAEEFKNYGTAVTAMIGQIEATGRQVELDLVIVDQLRHHKAILGWKVKRAGDNVDLSAIAYSLAHPAAFRRIGFALIERTPGINSTPGYGRCSGLTPELAAHINAEGAFLLGGIGESFGSCKTMAGALKYAANEINNAAGETIVELVD